MGGSRVVGDLSGYPAILIMIITRLFALFLAVLGFGDLQALLPAEHEHEHSMPVEESAASSEHDSAAGKPIAPLLGGLGTWSFKVTTKSARAQQFIDQGIRMVYAFNHAEAVRAFQEAAPARSRRSRWRRGAKRSRSGRTSTRR